MCLSALLTTTMMSQKEVVEALKEAGIQEKAKIMVGGAPVTQSYASEIGTDAYTPTRHPRRKYAGLFMINRYFFQL